MFTNKLSKFRKDLGVSMIGSIISFVISLGLTPLMTRLYEPSDYGIFALVNNSATFIATFFLLSLPGAFSIEPFINRRVQLLKAVLHLAVFSFLLSIIIVIIIYMYRYIFNGQDETEWFLLLFPFLIFAISIQKIGQSLAVANEAFSNIAIARILHPLTAKTFSIFASMITFSSALYLIIFEALGYLIQSFFMLKARKEPLKILPSLFIKPNLILIRGVMNRYRDFVSYFHLSNMILLAYLMFITIIISLNYSTTETGLFTLANSMTNLPVQLISLATASVVYQKLIKIYKEEESTLFKSVLKLLLIYMLLGIIPYLIIFIFGSELFGFVFGKEWTESGIIASTLAFSVYLQFVIMPIASIFIVTRQLKLKFWIDLVFLPSTIVMIYIVSLNVSFQNTIVVLAFLMALYSLVTLFFCLKIAWDISYKSKNKQIN